MLLLVSRLPYQKSPSSVCICDFFNLSWHQSSWHSRCTITRCFNSCSGNSRFSFIAANLMSQFGAISNHQISWTCNCWLVMFLDSAGIFWLVSWYSVYDPSLRRCHGLESAFLMIEGTKKRKISKASALAWWRLYLVISYWSITVASSYSNLTR